MIAESELQDGVWYVGESTRTAVAQWQSTLKLFLFGHQFPNTSPGYMRLPHASGSRNIVEEGFAPIGILDPQLPRENWTPMQSIAASVMYRASRARMVEACSSCGYTVDPKCEVCKGEGEYDARVSAVCAQEDADFQARALAMVTNLPTNGAVNIQTNRAIDLIGCAIVAFKADVPLHRSPQVLLGKRSKTEGLDLWVLPGGKQNHDESPEHCVRRETREEVGVTNLISLRPVSFSYNDTEPDRKYLMLYFTAYVAREEPYIAAANEFSDLRWFDVDMLPVQMWQSDRDAIANALLMRPK